MKLLTNWDNKNWLSSKKYISKFHIFLKSNFRFSKSTKVLDIGCGRANIISFLQKKYNFKYKAVGLDILKNKDIKKNIIFKKTDAINFLKKNNKFDLIMIKQTIHFFSGKKLVALLDFCKNSLNLNGKILIFFFFIKNNKIPCFKYMKQRLDISLKKDEFLLKLIRKKLDKIDESNFNFKVSVSKQKYIKMIKDRYISCLLNISNKKINEGINEINIKFTDKIKFTDTLKCISFRK